MPLYELKSYRAECDTCKRASFYFDRLGPEQAVPDGWGAVPLYGMRGIEDYRFMCPDCQAKRKEGKDNGRS